MKIFLSYPSEIRGTAEPIAFSLRARGHNVFFDRDDLPAGKSYDDQIHNAIEQSDLLVYLIAPASVQLGRYTLTEIEFARRAWRHPAGRVLPVMIERTDISKVPAFLKGVTILEPKGNVAAEVAAAVERLRGSGLFLSDAGRTAAISGGLTVALVLVISLLPYEYHPPQWFKIGVLFGGPLAVLLYYLIGKLSWRLLAPLPAMIVAFQLASPFLATGTGVVTPIEVHEFLLAEPSEAAIDDETRKRVLDQIEGWNTVVRILNSHLNSAICGTILMLGVLAGTLPILAPWLSVARCLICLVVGAVAAIIAAWVGALLFGISELFAFPVGFGLYMAASGGGLGYWHARGRIRQ